MLTKVSRNFYLAEETLDLVRVMSERLSISQAQVVERAVEVLAKEQALKDWATLKEWWQRQPEHTKQMLASMAEEQSKYRLQAQFRPARTEEGEE